MELDIYKETLICKSTLDPIEKINNYLDSFKTDSDPAKKQFADLIQEVYGDILDPSKK